MATSKDFIGYGLDPAIANDIGFDSKALALTAAGSTIADALAITNRLSVLTTVGSGTGVQLPASGGKGIYVVVNKGANALSVYPQSTQKINDGNNGDAASVASGARRVFYPSNTGWIGGF